MPTIWKSELQQSFAEKKIYGVSQCVVLGPLLSKTFQHDLFVIPENNYCTGYEDDTTHYVVSSNIEEILIDRKFSKIVIPSSLLLFPLKVNLIVKKI